MEQLITILCILGFLVLFITLVGHGLWLLFAAMFGAMSGKTPDPPNQNRKTTSQSTPQQTTSKATSRQEDTQAVMREYRRMLQRGQLSQAEHARLIKMLHDPTCKLKADLISENLQPLPLSGESQPKPEKPVVHDQKTLDPIPLEKKPKPQSIKVTPSVTSQKPTVDLGVEDEELVVASLVEEVSPTQPIGQEEKRKSALQRLQRPAEPVHPLDQEPEPPRPPVVRQKMADLLQAFMAEKNIRWGELLSGLLIVGSAVGLVISLRTALSDTIPYFAALLFMLITLAIYGAGMYTLKRWNLKTTSRGVLIIAMLLIPLNFLAAIFLSDSQPREVTDPFYLLAVVVGLGCFGWITYSAGISLVGEGWKRLAIVIFSTSIGQLIIDRMTLPVNDLKTTTLLLALPVIGFLIGMLLQLNRSIKWKQISFKRAEEIFIVLGLSVFSLLAPLGIFLSHNESILDALGNMTPFLSMSAAVLLGTGLLVHRRSTSKLMTTWRTTGTAIALIGGVMMGGAVLLAWPEPPLLIAVGIVNFIILSLLAVISKLPRLHIVAIGCLALSYLVGFHLFQDHFTGHGDELSWRLWEVFTLGSSSVALTLFAALIGTIGVVIFKQRYQEEGRNYFLSTAGLAVISIVIALYSGFGPGGDTWLATPILAFYTLGAFIVACLKFPAPNQTKQICTYVGSGLLLSTLVHGLWMNDPLVEWLSYRGLAFERPVLVAFLIHAIVCAVAALVASWKNISISPSQRKSQIWHEFALPLSIASLVTALLAAPFAILVLHGQFSLHAFYLLGISIVWLIFAVLHRRSDALMAFQCFATLTICFIITSYSQQQNWGQDWFSDLRHWQIQLGVLALWCMAWSLLRCYAKRWKAISQVLRSTLYTVDEVILHSIVLVMFGLGVWACWPGMLHELGILSIKNLQSPEIYGLNAWGVWALVSLALLSGMRERLTRELILALIIATAAVPLLLAAPWESVTATASAMRWFFAIYVLLSAAAVWFRQPLGSKLNAWLGCQTQSDETVLVRDSALLLGSFPVVALTTITAVRVASDLPIGQPSPDCWFGGLSHTVSFIVPLIFLVATFLGHAIRERRSIFALAGSLLTQYIVTLAYTMEGTNNSPEFWAELLQWNAVALGVYSIVWLALEHWIGPKDSTESDLYLDIQLKTTLGTVGVLAIWAAFAVVLVPDRLPQLHAQPLGGWASFLAWGLALGGSCWTLRHKKLEVQLSWLSGFALAFTAILAMYFDLSDVTTPRSWLAYHVLTSGWLITAGCLTAAAIKWPKLWRDATVIGALCIFLAVRGSLFDPQMPWWSVGTFVVLAILSGVAAWSRRSQLYAYVSTLLTLSAASVYGIVAISQAASAEVAVQKFVLLVELNLLALIISAGVWLMIEIFYQRRNQTGLDSEFKSPRIHVLSAIAATVGAILFYGAGFCLNCLSGEALIDTANPFSVLVLIGLGGLLLSILWDNRSSFSIPALYAWGLIVVVFALDHAQLVLNPLQITAFHDHLNVPQAFFAMGMVITGYALLTSTLWRQGVLLSKLGQSLGIADPVQGLKRTARWLPVVNMISAIASVLIALVVVLSYEERWMRISSGFSPAFLAVALAALAQQHRRVMLQYATLLMTALSAIYLSWADIDPQWIGEDILERLIRFQMVLSGLTFMYGAVIARQVSEESDWRTPVQSITKLFASLAGASLLMVLAVEALYYETGEGSPVGAAQAAAIAVIMGLFIVGLIMMALSKAKGTSEEQRMWYVYGAEAVGALIFAHLMMTLPEWFQNFRPYWPYVVMAIAFVGVGIGELFQRKGVRVLGEPLQRTGAFLPLLPVLGIWMYSADSTHYPSLLFGVGVLYTILSFARKSPLSSVAAVIAANAAFWALLSENDFSFLLQPQFWLIPPAASVLVAAHLNRQQLSEKQLTAIRYACVMLIYVSSSGEMFMRGVGESIWGPIVLLSLSVLGVFAGMIFQVRAFLYLGSSFVLLSIVSMVWHATKAIDHTWPWWAFGIGLGICILVLFGLFEKNRPAMMKWVEKLRSWEQ